MSDSVLPHRLKATRLPRPWDSPGKNTGVGYHFLLQCMKVKSKSEVAQSYPTLSDPWTAAYQASLSMGFSRQEYWSGLPLPSPNRIICIDNYFKCKWIKCTNQKHRLAWGGVGGETRKDVHVCTFTFHITLLNSPNCM